MIGRNRIGVQWALLVEVPSLGRGSAWKCGRVCAPRVPTLLHARRILFPVCTCWLDDMQRLALALACADLGAL